PTLPLRPQRERPRLSPQQLRFWAAYTCCRDPGDCPAKGSSRRCSAEQKVSARGQEKSGPDLEPPVRRPSSWPAHRGGYVKNPLGQECQKFPTELHAFRLQRRVQAAPECPTSLSRDVAPRVQPEGVRMPFHPAHAGLPGPV